MKKIICILALLAPLSGIATTKIKEVGQSSRAACEIRAKFLQPVTSRSTVTRNGKVHPVDMVFWKVDVLEVSRSGKCPPLGITNIRVRGAMLKDATESPQITYMVGFEEPRANAQVDMAVEYSKGEDNFTKVKFEEFFLKRVNRE